MTRAAITGAAAAGVITGAAAAMAWAVRGRSSGVFGPSLWHGSRSRPAIALTFDDGPSPGTAAILDILREYGVRATFFQCGENVLRDREMAQRVCAAGHEIGNHSHSHPNFVLRSAPFVEREFVTAQRAILDATGQTPQFLRAPYGVRWFGFRKTQAKLGLTGIMWTVIGLDWKLQAREVAARILKSPRAGDIICLHDGRATLKNPDIGATVEAVRRIVPEMLQKGYHFETIAQLICPVKSSPTI